VRQRRYSGTVLNYQAARYPNNAAEGRQVGDAGIVVAVDVDVPVDDDAASDSIKVGLRVDAAAKFRVLHAGEFANDTAGLADTPSGVVARIRPRGCVAVIAGGPRRLEGILTYAAIALSYRKVGAREDHLAGGRVVAQYVVAQVGAAGRATNRATQELRTAGWHPHVQGLATDLVVVLVGVCAGTMSANVAHCAGCHDAGAVREGGLRVEVAGDGCHAAAGGEGCIAADDP